MCWLSGDLLSLLTTGSCSLESGCGRTIFVFILRSLFHLLTKSIVGPNLLFQNAREQQEDGGEKHKHFYNLPPLHSFVKVLINKLIIESNVIITIKEFAIVINMG